MCKWLVALFLLLPLAAQATELGDRKVTQHFQLPCGWKKATVQFSAPTGTDLDIRLHRPEKCSGGSVSNWGFRPAVAAGFGMNDQGIALALSAEVGFHLTDSLELVGQVDGSLLESQRFGTGLSGGVAGWVNDQFRVGGFLGGATVRDHSWSYLSSGPLFAAQADFTPDRKKGGLDVALRAFVGPSWTDADHLSTQWGATLMLGWMGGGH
jgi:hypothetical protein